MTSTEVLLLIAAVFGGLLIAGIVVLFTRDAGEPKEPRMSVREFIRGIRF